MSNNSFSYSFKVTNLERKQVASLLAETLGGEVTYQGPPSFSYHVQGWVIDRNGVVTSLEIEQKDTLRKVLDALKTAGVLAEGNGTVTCPMTEHNGNTLRNLVNLIWTKQKLIQRALGRETTILPESLVTTINAVPIETLEDFAEVINSGIESGTIVGDSDLEFDLADKTISFSFSNASLESDEVFAFVALCQRISEQAKQQRFSSTLQREVVNDKYAFRCFLLKLGFVGAAFKAERKSLLSRLIGDGAYRTEEARQAAEAKRKVPSLDA